MKSIPLAISSHPWPSLHFKQVPPAVAGPSPSLPGSWRLIRRGLGRKGAGGGTVSVQVVAHGIASESPKLTGGGGRRLIDLDGASRRLSAPGGRAGAAAAALGDSYRDEAAGAALCASAARRAGEAPGGPGPGGGGGGGWDAAAFLRPGDAHPEVSTGPWAAAPASRPAGRRPPAPRRAPPPALRQPARGGGGHPPPAQPARPGAAKGFRRGFIPKENDGGNERALPPLKAEGFDLSYLTASPRWKTLPESAALCSCRDADWIR